MCKTPNAGISGLLKELEASVPALKGVNGFELVAATWGEGFYIIL